MSISRCSGGLRPLVELCVEPAGLCGRCTGVAVPLRVVPSPTGLPSKRCGGGGAPRDSAGSGATEEGLTSRGGTCAGAVLSLAQMHRGRRAGGALRERPGGRKRRGAGRAGRGWRGPSGTWGHRGAAAPRLPRVPVALVRAGQGRPAHGLCAHRSAPGSPTLLGTNGGSLWLWCCLA